MSFAAVVIYYVRLPKLIERMTFLSDILHLRYEKRSIAKASSSVVDSRFESHRSIQMVSKSLINLKKWRKCIVHCGSNVTKIDKCY